MVRAGTEVDLVKKATCSGVELQDNKQYLVMGSQWSEVNHNNVVKSVFLSVTCRSSSRLSWRSPVHFLQVSSPAGLGGSGGAVAGGLRLCGVSGIQHPAAELWCGHAVWLPLIDENSFQFHQSFNTMVKLSLMCFITLNANGIFENKGLIN